MKRLLFLVMAVFLWHSDAFACRSDEFATGDVTTFKDNLNVDLNDYGVIFEEAAPWSGCTQAAADALYKKLYTHFHPPLAGIGDWPHNDPQVCANGSSCAYQFQGWLQGGVVGLIHATALRLANVGKLSKPLDDLIQRIPYQMNVDLNCGFEGNALPPYPPNTRRWEIGNSCMEDYTIGAMGWAWIAAYKSLRGLGSGWYEANNARNAIRSSLSTTDSICAWSGAPSIFDQGRGPCTGNVADLREHGYQAMSLHGGDSIAYGLGLLTSVGAASVGLVKAGYPLDLDADEELVVRKLYADGLAHTDGNSFYTDCYQFSLSGGYVQASPTYRCEDQAGHPYRPKMFPVRDFIAAYAPDALAEGTLYSEFDPTLFCDTSVGMGSVGDCAFYNPGRRSIYGHMGQTWVQSPPNFVNTGLSDYTVTFRTYNGNYLSARYGGGQGSDVNAQPFSAGSSEQFSVYIRTAGHTQLMDGDEISIQSLTSDRAHYVAAEGGGGSGSVLNADRLYPHQWETFTIRKLNGTGAINSGDPVALQSYNGYYVSAENGGGSTVLADKTWTLSWETFTITMTHN